jgi:RNA polymerase sigma factor (sigma-70 family)
MDELCQYTPLVRAMVRRYRGPGLEGEDLAQEAWLALIKARRDYRPELGARPAFYRCRVRAALADVLRRYRRDALFWRSSSLVEEMPQPGPPRDGFDELVAGLTRRQRQVLAMYYRDDLPLREIARRLGLSLSAVHTHKQRGLEALRHQSRSKN